MWGLPGTSTPGTKVTLTFDYSGPDIERGGQPDAGRSLCFGGQNVRLPAAARAVVPAHELPFEPLHRNFQDYRSRLIRRGRHRQSGRAEHDACDRQGHAGPSGLRVPLRPGGSDGSFVAGSLQLSPVQTEGYQVSVYTAKAQASTAAPYANSLAHIMSYFSDTFGQLENGTTMTIAQLPDGSLNGFSAPGLLLISERQWTHETERPIALATRRRAMVGRSRAAGELRRHLAHRRSVSLRGSDVRGAIGRRSRAAQCPGRLSPSAR